MFSLKLLLKADCRTWFTTNKWRNCDHQEGQFWS